MSRPRDRSSGLGLLPRMEARPGKRGTSYRYKPVDGPPIYLGTDKNAAIRAVLDLNGATPHLGTLRWVWESYSQSRRFLRLAEATRVDYAQCWLQLDRVLGHLPIAAIDGPIVARFVYEERAGAPIRANREKSLLSNLFAHGITLGVCKDNPARLVRPNEEEPRTVAPDPLVLARFLRWVLQQSPQRRIVGLAAKFASLEGSRKVEFLPLAWPQVDVAAGVVRMRRAKQRGTRRELVVDEVVITPALQACLDELRACRPAKRESLAVFPQRNGNAYTARGFKTLWQRIVAAAIAAGVISQADRFTFHDLRAFYSTEHKRRHGTLPDLHKNPATTASIYDRSTTVRRSAL
jgi:integrase